MICTLADCLLYASRQLVRVEKTTMISPAVSKLKTRFTKTRILPRTPMTPSSRPARPPPRPATVQSFGLSQTDSGGDYADNPIRCQLFFSTFTFRAGERET